MMDPAKFDDGICRLREAFGDRAFPNPLVKLIWKEVSNFSEPWFNQIVDQFIGELRYPPKVIEFREAAARERERNWQREKKTKIEPEWQPNPRCSYCLDAGLYLCTKSGTPGFWAFRCHCTAGESDFRKQIPQFKQYHADEGYRLYDARNLRSVPKPERELTYESI